MTIRSAVTVCTLLAMTSLTKARHPDRLYYYRFDTSLSHLDVTGGFAGISETHGVDGTFSLHYAAVHNEDTLYEVYFHGVDAKLTGDGIFGGRSLDEVLNLTGLRGELVNANQVGFIGVEIQNLAMLLGATQDDHTIALDGQNVPQCCDFFNFTIHAVADLLPPIHTQVVGDMDGNGVVDAFDVDDFETALAGAAAFTAANPDMNLVEAGDVNGDGVFDAFDVGPFEQLVADQSVPEPAVFTLLGAAGLALLSARRRRRA